MASLVEMSAEEREQAKRETMEAVRQTDDAIKAAMLRQAAVSFAKGLEAGEAIAREAARGASAYL